MAEPGTLKTLRASAALPASGNFDPTPTTVTVKPTTRGATILVTFTRGSGSSAFALRVRESNDGTTWFYQTAADGTSTASAPFLRVPFHATEYRSPVPASGSAVRFAIPITLSGAKYVSIECAEYGDTAAPGTLGATLVEGE